jgi:uncharacterized protein YbaP (TraB family)
MTVALALLLAACGQQPPAPPPVMHDADPALWVVRDADTTIYLFGTVHLLKPGTGWFDEAVRKAFDRSDQLVLELVNPGDEAMAALMTELGATNAPPLSSQLPPETGRKLEAALASLGEQPRALERDKPWYAAVILSVLPLDKLGYDAKDGPEKVLADAAAKAGKPVIGLETAREQLGYLDALSPAAQRALLETAIDEVPTAGASLEQTIQAWGEGDVTTLGSVLNDELKSSPELKAAMLVTRNRRWADWIAARMRQPGTLFIAVGAGHLTGPDALQWDLLRRGLTVKRIVY